MVFVNNQIERMKTITLMGQTYRSLDARSHRGAHAQVQFQRGTGTMAWPCEIQYFFRHKLSVDNVMVDHVMAFVRWFSVPDGGRYNQHTDPFVETWQSEYRPLAYDCVIPVHRLFTQVAVIKSRRENNANGPITVIPLHKKMLA